MDSDKFFNMITLLSVVFFVLGLIVAISNTNKYLEFQDLEEGEVTLDTALVKDYESETIRTRHNGRTDRDYRYTYTFEYYVDGVTYTGTTSDRTEFERYNHPESFEIYYYTDDPADHFLVSDVEVSNLFWWAVPPVCVVAFFLSRKFKDSVFF